MAEQKKSTNGSKLIYLVDDDPVYLTLLQSDFHTMPKTKTKTFTTGEACLKQMHLNPAMVVLDYELADDDSAELNGVEVLRKIKETNPETEVVMLSGWDDVIIAVASIKFGAYDYVIKNESALINIKNKSKKIFRELAFQRQLREDKSFKYFAGGFLLLIAVLILILYWFVSP